MKAPARAWLAAAGAVLILALAASPFAIRSLIRARSSNPVRRGYARAQELGCFSCHGERGTAGIPQPEPAADARLSSTADKSVPAWGGGVWMMFVENDDDIRSIILTGREPAPAGESDDRENRPGQASAAREAASRQDAGPEDGPPIRMPAYASVLRGSDLDDLVALFRVLSGMNLPQGSTPERAGYEIARKRGCFSCHGPAASGGLPNPGSLAGYIPAWYGPDFRDLVRSRAEFDEWVRTGSLARLGANPVSAFFLQRQRLPMPPYASMPQEDLDALWSYARWLERTGGGYTGGVAPW